jgi:hypothetical protein
LWLQVLLVRLIDLLLLMDGRRPEPLCLREPVSPRIDRGWHPGPRHGSRDVESRNGWAELLLHGWPGVRLLAGMLLLGGGVGCRGRDGGLGWGGGCDDLLLLGRRNLLRLGDGGSLCLVTACCQRTGY